MIYEKTTWQNGDVITAEKLNNIENWINGLKPTRIINFWDLPQIENASQHERQYEKDFEMVDFVNCYIYLDQWMYPIVSYDFDTDTWVLKLEDGNANKYRYQPNTGKFTMQV